MNGSAPWRGNAAAVVLACVLAACGGGGSTSVAPPAFTAQPQAIEVKDGSSATFNASATGAGPLAYQWQKNGIAIAGATAASYSTPPLSLSDSHSLYSVLVTNAGGVTTSQSAAVTIDPVAPAIDVQPASISVSDGATATFSVHAGGSQPQSYQWSRDNVPLVGANASSFTLDAATLADSGATFSVQVSNIAGGAVSQVAALSVTPVAAHIITAPQAQTVPDGATATFSVSAAGSATLAYQWYVGGVPAAGATSASYAFTAAYADNGKQLSVVVSNAYGNATSGFASLTVDPQAPALTSEPQQANIQVGGSASFVVTSSGTVPLSYQWQRSDDGGLTWTSIAAATSQEFDVTQATLAWADSQLRVAVSNVAGTTLSGSVALRVAPGVHIVAGIAGGSGYADGSGAGVRFYQPWASVVDTSGNVLVADRFNDVIRRIAPDGTVGTVAGRLRQRGLVDGPAASALLNFPAALALDAAGNLYVADSTAIRRIAIDGTVSTVAGQLVAGSADGTGSAASFSDIEGLVSDAVGNLVVVDAGANQTVRKVSAAGVVTTLAGTAGQTGFQDGTGPSTRFAALSTLALGADGNYYVADNDAIRQVTPGGVVTRYAGTPGLAGETDGQRLAALFGQVNGLGFDPAGNLYVADGAFVRRIAPDGTTTTLAGGGTSLGGDIDGTAGTAYINGTRGLSLTADGTGFVFASPNAGTVRVVSLAGAVTTLAGVSPQYAHVDGPGSVARFYSVSALANDAQGNVYMSEGGYHAIRRIDTSGAVSTITLNQVAFSNANAIAVDATGGLYVADTQLQQVAKVAADGTVTVLAGVASTIGHNDGAGAQATFAFPMGLAVDASGNVFVADSQNSVIRKIDTSGVVTTIAGQPGVCGSSDGSGSAALLCHPTGMAFDAQGRLVVADAWADTLRRVDLTDGSVVTIGGAPFAAGLANGAVSRFSAPTALAFDGQGNLYVADGGNGVIRRLTPAGIASTVIGQPGTFALQPGVGGAINSAAGLTVLPSGRVVLATELAVVGD